MGHAVNSPERTKQLNEQFGGRLDQLINMSIISGAEPGYIAAELYNRVLATIASEASDADFIEETIEDFATYLRSAVKAHANNTETGETGETG